MHRITLSQKIYVRKEQYNQMDGPPETRFRALTFFTQNEIEDVGGDFANYIEIKTHDSSWEDPGEAHVKSQTRLTNALASVVERVADVAVEVIAAAQKGVPQ